jgi:hypothetical protein
MHANRNKNRVPNKLLKGRGPMAMPNIRQNGSMDEPKQTRNAERATRKGGPDEIANSVLAGGGTN